MNAAAGLRSRPLAWIYFLVGVATTGLYFALPWDSFAQALVYDGIGASAAVAVLLGTWIHHPSLRLPWYLFGAGLFAFTAGDVIFNLYSQVWDRDPPVPSVADVFYLAGYPFLTAGLVLLVLRLRSEERRAGRIDAALLIVAFALFQWIFVMDDLVRDSGSVAEKVVGLSYPVMDVVLLMGLVFLALTPAWRTLSYRYLTASIVLLLIADEVYGLAPGNYANASWLDAGWLLSYVLWGVAALHPSMRALSKPSRGRGPRLSTSRLVVLGAALAAAPAVLVIQRATGSDVDAVAVAVGAAALSGLVLWRLAGLIRALDRLRGAERVARTEAENAHRLLAEQNEQLREADRLKDEFVALISHDLRTPLTSILGYLELTLEDEELTGTQRGYLEVVDRNAQRLLRLVSDLLFVARLEAGQLELHQSELDLAAVVRQSVAEAEPRAAAGGIKLTCETEPVPHVNADKGRIFQLLDNLVSNAIKFTPDGGSVRVSVTAANGGVLLEVADTGMGIPSDEQRRLFERFFRSSTASERQIQGTGLGLYIARAIVEAHGGDISFESEPGRGTAFRIEMPVERAAVPA
jgi:signal transduction histidine kinase